jgi:UDP-glucose 4-epimerase
MQTNELKRCVVTGGGGFIGSHLVDRLIADGHHVTVIDNFSTGRLTNLSAHINETRLSVVEADVSDDQSLRNVIEPGSWVFHLAALADIVPSIQEPIRYHRANVDGTIHVLEAARQANASRFVYAASSSCYGIPDLYPTPESSPIRPMYPYAMTKYLGEQYVQHWHQVYHLPTVSLRLFNVYGPRSRTTGSYGAVFGVFLGQKLAGKPFTIVGDGTQSRDFTYVTDVVDAFVRAAASNLSGEIFNVGTGNPQTVNRLVELLGDGNRVYIPKRPGEPDSTCAQTQRIRAQLRWAASVSFERGVQEMLERIELWRDAPVWEADSIADATRAWFQFLGNDES